MKKMTKVEIDQITAMAAKAQPGDILAVRTRTLMGFFIRRMLSKGLHRCHTNHNAPVFGLVPRVLQIEPPKARVIWLVDYLADLYQHGGSAILLRPDSFLNGVCPELRGQLADEYCKLAGLHYDKLSIRMFVRMIYRKSAKLAANLKNRIYCTEGTLLPILNNTLQPWRPDILKNESYPAPIHVEHLIRQNRLEFVAGNRKLYDGIFIRFDEFLIR